jgi:uncharacterized membrane protein YdjX (TVP38/TMEM64 family)
MGGRLAGGSAFLVLTIAVLLMFVGDTGLLEWLSTAQVRVLTFVHMRPLFAAACYVAFVASGTVTPVPSAIVLMLLGGYLFGPVVGGFLSAAGSTLSALAVCLVGRMLFSDLVRRVGAERFVAVENAVRVNALRYLLAVRLLPGLPAWFANLLPVPFRVPLRTVLFATFFGILPISVITAYVGSGLATLQQAGVAAARDLLLSPQMLLPCVALLVLAVVMVAGKKRGC